MASKYFCVFPLLVFIDWFESERERDHSLSVSLTYTFIGWFLYVPWPGIEPATMVYWEDAPTELPGQGDPSLSLSLLCLSLSFLRFYLFIFSERGREGEKHQCVVAFRGYPGGNLAHNPGICPDPESNQRPFGSQAGAQSTEPHQPRPSLLKLNKLYGLYETLRPYKLSPFTVLLILISTTKINC